MPSPLVSVLISTYERPSYLRSALRTAVNQSIRDIEIIVRDDFGTVDVQTIVDEFQDSRISLRRNDRNMGLAATNSLLYCEARGTFVAHLDDDDEWLPDFLERLVEPLQADTDLDMSFTNHAVIDAAGGSLDRATERGRKRWGRKGLKLGVHQNGRSLAAMQRAVPTSHAAVLRRSAIGSDGFDSQVGRAWDMWVASVGARRTGRVWFDPLPLSRYRIHDSQMSDFGRRRLVDDSMFEGLVWCLERLAEDPAFVAERAGLMRQLAAERCKWSLHKLLQGRSSEAISLSQAATVDSPSVLTYLCRTVVKLMAAAPGSSGQLTVKLAATARTNLANWHDQSAEWASIRLSPARGSWFWRSGNSCQQTPPE